MLAYFDELFSYCGYVSIIIIGFGLAVGFEYYRLFLDLGDRLLDFLWKHIVSFFKKIKG